MYSRVIILEITLNSSILGENEFLMDSMIDGNAHWTVYKYQSTQNTKGLLIHWLLSFDKCLRRWY